MGKVCFDFDGVIHSYTSGFLGDGIIPDPPVPGISQVIDRLHDAGYTVVVCSSRSATAEGRKAMWEWFDKWDITIDDIYATKPPARCYVDDRAVLFTGDTSTLFETIDSFEPWWRDLPANKGTKDTDQPPKKLMGAIVGDIVGSVYEFDNIHTEDFPLFGTFSGITDDSVLTIAVAKSFLDQRREDKDLYDALVDNLRTFGRHYPEMSYGGRFFKWMWSDEREPQSSWGNGAPMRCSAAGWVTNDTEQAYHLGALTAHPTHSHPTAENAAGTVAGLICLARKGEHKPALREYAVSKGFRIPTMVWLREHNVFSEESRDTTAAALGCFFGSESFEDCVRKSVSIGGDSDTIAAIAGSIAEAYYGVPDGMRQKAWTCIPSKLRRILLDFDKTF